jgi:general secretion pathway protein L
MVVDGAGHQVVPPGTATLAGIAAMLGQRRVAVIVPGADVLGLEAELPPLSGSRLLQAIPFAVEEQVAEDVDTLHFAAGARQPNGRTPVEVVSRPLIEGWLQELAAVGIAPQAMYADTGLLPLASGQSVALLESADVSIRVDEHPVLRLPAAPFAEAVSLAFGADAGSLLPPLTLYASPADWEVARPEVDPLRERFASFKVQLLPNGPLPLLAPRAVGARGDEAPPLNLLQGAFAPRSRTRADWRPWRLAAALGALALAMHLGALAFEYRQLRASERALDAAIAEVVRSTLPGDSGAPNPRLRIEQQLLAVRAGQGDTGPWLSALAALAQARGASPEAELESVGLESDAVNVRIKAANAESLERISATLRANGWQAELQGGSASEDAYEGRIRLRVAGSES